MEHVRSRYEGRRPFGDHGTCQGEWRVILSAMMLSLLAGALPFLASAQSMADSEHSSGAVALTTEALSTRHYIKPATRMKFHSYLFHAFGLYPSAGAAFAKATASASAPPSAFAAVSTTTRYGLAQAFKEDTLYYCCECKGVFPRLRHCPDPDPHSTPGRRWSPCLLFSGAHRPHMAAR
jgi:hypothetical protein